MPKHDTILGGCRHRGNDLQHADQAVAHLHNPTFTA
ncbi:hypothetical protein SO3561_09040 [Streptomyces olivochromogenes]|uniref:Uncharacterized protein n=1 Tax=Streptomyces olivochromogenes TaxID=1963 RepID=A0A250VU24_STROL|nr:hypothetical protein SO3561_09040 [Streptomyces olivochromogenes]